MRKPQSMNEVSHASFYVGVKHLRDGLKQRPPLQSHPVCHLLGRGGKQIRGFSKDVERRLLILSLELKALPTKLFKIFYDKLKSCSGIVSL